MQKMMNLIFWVRAMGILSLVQMQTLRVLQTIYLPHPPCPQPLPFSSLSLKTPAKTVPTPGTALQHKIETNLEKALGNSLNIHLQQQICSFQASMLEAFQSLREELTSKKKLNPGLPRINSMRNPMNLGSHLLNLKNSLIRVNIKPGPDMCHLPQRRISPL